VSGVDMVFLLVTGSAETVTGSPQGRFVDQ